LISLKKFNVSKVQITEGEDLDMQKIGESIYNIIKSIDENEKLTSKANAIDGIQSGDLYTALVSNIDSKEMRAQMHVKKKE